MTDRYQQKYPRPPIFEAVVELRFEPSLPDKMVHKIGTKFKRRYPLEIAQELINFTFDTNSQKTTSNKLAKGMRWSSNDQTNVVTVINDRFSYSHLAPYPGWGAYRQALKTNWDLFHSTAKPNRLTRVGMRYINRIDIPCASERNMQFEDYLAYYPLFENPKLGAIVKFFCQVQVDTGIDDCSATVSVSPAPETLVDHISIFLDIDVSREEKIPQSDHGLFDLLDKMRDIRNIIFEGAITDRTRDLFQ